MGVYNNQENKILDWSKFILAVLISQLDTAFTHGYHLGCLRGMKGAVKEWLITKDLLTNTTGMKHDTSNKDLIHFMTFLDGIYSAGGVLGCCFIVFFANTFGRRGGILMTSFISIFASLFGGYSKYFDSVILLLISRVLYGVKQGINSGLGPMYLIEISPQNLRGQIGTLYGLVYSIGRDLGIKAGEIIGNKFHWPLVLSLPVIPAIIQLILFPFCPESPKYLYVIKGNERLSRKALQWLRGSNYKEEEMVKLRDERHQYRVIGKMTVKMILQNAILRHALITTIIVTSSQQLCGVTILLLYVNRHLKDESLKSHYFTVKVAPAVVMLFVIDRLRRRTLYLVSFLGMTLSSLVLFGLFEVLYKHYPLNESVIFVFGSIYLLTYKLGCGILAWFCASELFNTSGAPIGYAFGSAINWLLKFFVISLAAPFASVLGGYGFINFAVTNFALLYYTYSKVPETCNKSIKEVYRHIYLLLKK